MNLNDYNYNLVNNIFNKLLENRIIFINGIIDDLLSNNIVSQLLFLESEDKNKEINIYINSPGGYITSGMAIYDTMMIINPDIKTICLGQACSMAAILLLSGTNNKRYALPNSRIMIHQPIGGYYGQASDMNIYTKEIIKLKKIINEIISKHTKQSIKKIEKDSDRDYF